MGTAGLSVQVSLDTGASLERAAADRHSRPRANRFGDAYGNMALRE